MQIFVKKEYWDKFTIIIYRNKMLKYFCAALNLKPTNYITGAVRKTIYKQIKIQFKYFLNIFKMVQFNIV